MTDVENKYQHNEYKSSKIADLLRQEIESNKLKIIVLDDDPTGVQAVHDVFVYTDWNYESILEGFLSEDMLFYILTNSRAMTEQQTTKVHIEIAKNIIRAAKETGMNFQIISRGDSTLRGHYPLETFLLKEELEKGLAIKVDGEILIPFFKAGGRYTIDNIHYVRYEEELIPAADTEFARDKTFGYTSSNLCEYIEEKTGGAYLAESVKSVSLDQLRGAELEVIKETLLGVEGFGKVIVNAIDTGCLETFCVAFYRAIKGGRHYLFRTAADFIKVIGGIADQPLLRKEDMITVPVKRGGIVVIGSHTEKTTAQLEALKDMEELEFLEFNSDLVLEDRLEEEVERVTARSKALIEEGKTVVTYTKRRLLTLDKDTKEKALLRSVKISESVLKLVSELGTVPGFVIAKGGITSSDIGVRALKVRKAYVLGQIQPGIPVWKTDENSRFPGIPYIIFPGNVGEKQTLKKILQELI
ncbi:four-carbon acid sugar kinase family protein [Anaerocolumna sp. AGMB13020]|uniref:four-carbon acid sugar kinase family protein n=1 Tax=Anaerocolumna sp. AGMB13020 TaxID=3081750 RepID=UPI002955A938|nr:four-carbon acid sugar kinase family protein [Anaerocolumna sp. AGMB13020]WOO39127.1 four-carbon acid sugar kinase family protein [Anaerocolumna sp. AGMB13020]